MGELRKCAHQSQNRFKLARAWLQQGRQNYKEYIKNNPMPIRKKYVHVLRALLCSAWVQRQNDAPQPHRNLSSFPPAAILDLIDDVLGAGMISEREAAVVRE